MTSPVGKEPSFSDFVRRVSASGKLIVQPRMGFSDPARMRAGLAATRQAAATTVGTITLDSYTRLGNLPAVDAALAVGTELNGYPILSHRLDVSMDMLDGVLGPDFPVQVRHGSARPAHILAAVMALGLDACEGGPVSYCLPYGRTPLAESIDNWSRSCEMFSQLNETGRQAHLESFGGCMLGQLCPPSQLVAISVLEALFFRQHGLRSVSVSYAQQTNPGQDREAVFALRRLCAELLDDVDWHVVVYAYMGMYPASERGAYALLGEAARLAVETGSERLIVKTVAESSRIPTVAENVDALEYAAAMASCSQPTSQRPPADSQTYAEAAALVDAVRDLCPDLGTAFRLAFQRGYLDIPFCIHPDNAGRSRTYIDDQGRLRWAEIGNLPIARLVRPGTSRAISSASLAEALAYVRDTFDGRASAGRLPGVRSPAISAIRAGGADM